MKKYLFAFVLTIAVSIASAQPPAGLAKPGDVFGNRISKNDAITLDLLSPVLCNEAPKLKIETK